MTTQKLDIKADKETIINLQPSNLENIDFAMFNWVNEKLNISANSNRGWEKVPVIWTSAERAFQAKRSKDLRDKEGALILPLITVERVSVEKDLTFKGSLQANVFPRNDYKAGSVSFDRVINQVKTKNFQNADAKKEYGQLNFKVKPINNKIVYTYRSIPIPVYVTVMYKVMLRAEYQQQINELSQPFMVSTGGINAFIIRERGHRYEGFLQTSYTQEDSVADMGEEERMYQTSIDIKVLGYLIGGGSNQETPQIVERENAVKIKLPRERVILGDTPPWENGKYIDI
tara:strand:- start:483 stop:1343 length:861 start_codon:yes stop_codon:yes gene_type:complete